MAQPVPIEILLHVFVRDDGTWSATSDRSELADALAAAGSCATVRTVSIRLEVAAPVVTPVEVDVVPSPVHSIIAMVS
jgi:hypothetical protein